MERFGPSVSDTSVALAGGHRCYGTNASEVLASLDGQLAETVRALDDDLGQTFEALFPPDIREGPPYVVFQAHEDGRVEHSTALVASSARSLPVLAEPAHLGDDMSRIEVIDPRAAGAEAFVDHQLSLQERVIEAQAIKTEFAQRQIERVNLHGMAVVADVCQGAEEIIARPDLSPATRAHLQEFGHNVIEATKRQVHAASLLGSKRFYDEIDRPLSPNAPPDLGSIVDRYLEERRRELGA